jgi:hypothetical protein
VQILFGVPLKNRKKRGVAGDISSLVEVHNLGDINCDWGEKLTSEFYFLLFW